MISTLKQITPSNTEISRTESLTENYIKEGKTANSVSSENEIIALAGINQISRSI